MRTFLLSATAVCALTGIAAAQSLGDVAKQEEARRKAVASAGKVYTSDSLRPEPSAAAPAVPAAAAATSAPAAPDKREASQDPKKDEANWKQRIAAERTALSRAQLFAESLQSRINALTNDFSARDDPFQRNQIGQDRQKAIAELDRVHKEIADHTKAITDIQEDARKAGVPAGWVR
jgi:chromosome segregation ATPase